MTQIVVDAVTRGKLCQLDHPAELLDEEGRVLGRFLPGADLAEYEPLEPQAVDARSPKSCATWRIGRELHRPLGARSGAGTRCDLAQRPPA
jgi:hypothetical protein